MSYCINPNCRNFSNATNDNCPNCGTETLLLGRYRVIRPLGRGAFGQTFEVDDVREDKRKVLKVLLTDYEHAVRLFQREANVLSQMDHPGIPRVESDGNFQLSSPGREEPLHCLVMEYIEGINLKDWLSNRNNQPITQEQAIAWLKQLAEILQQIHQRRYLHRDIKPSNIMRRPDGQLVLIDFGAVREATETYLKRLEQRDDGITAIIAAGYTPPEQANGRAVAKSDFYALGRTFVHLLTGRHPLKLHEDTQIGQLHWRNRAPQVSQELADLIDDLMAPSPANRPGNAQEILRRLQEIERPTSSTRRANSGNRRLALFLTVSAIQLLVAGAPIKSIEPPPQTACDSKLEEHLSCGGKVLVDSPVTAKKKGVEKFASGKYAEAVGLLEKAREEQPSDPETLIYLNNARLAKQKAYTIAVVAPIGKSSDTALEILRGVAQAQNEINQGKKIKGVGLRVLIADDANNPNQAKQIGEELVSKKDLLAVVGHYASEVTLATVPVYQQHQMVLISPGSTSEELSQWGKQPKHVFFRTVPKTQVAAQYLASYLSDQAHQQTAAVFYAPRSSFSQSLLDQFLMSFPAKGGKVVSKFDLSDPLFNAAAAIDQAQKQGDTALGVFPDGGTTPYGVSNTLKLIKANHGRYWIVGGSTLYSPDTLELLGKDALNRFVVVVSWHHLDSPNPEFPQAARNLWKGNVSWRTATAYDATRALIAALEKQQSPSRVSVQQVLAEKNFQAEGATGVISFNGGDRKEPLSTLVKVVPSSCSSESYEFVPVTYASDSLKGCKKEK